MQPERAARPSQGDQGDLEERAERQRLYQEAQARKREQARQERQLRTQIESLEDQLAAREETLQELEAIMASPGFYDDFEKANATTEEYTALKQAIEDGYEDWEHHSLALGALLEEMEEA